MDAGKRTNLLADAGGEKKIARPTTSSSAGGAARVESRSINKRVKFSFIFGSGLFIRFLSLKIYLNSNFRFFVEKFA